jgi:PmbA protein
MNPFFYSEQSLSDLAHSVLKKAEKRGFAVAVDVSESLGLSVNVRRNEMESVQHNHDKAINITAYIAGRGEPGYHSGNATTNDFSPASIDRTLEAAWQIASATQCDPYSGLPEAASLYRGGQPFGDLECFKPWEIDVDSAVALGREIEGSAFATDPRISNSEGAGVQSGASQSILAHSQGFSGYFQSSSHSISMVAIAQDDRDMQVDYWYSEGIDAWAATPPNAPWHASTPNPSTPKPAP